jgi:Na+/proline symporter
MLGETSIRDWRNLNDESGPFFIAYFAAKFFRRIIIRQTNREDAETIYEIYELHINSEKDFAKFSIQTKIRICC